MKHWLSVCALVAGTLSLGLMGAASQQAAPEQVAVATTSASKTFKGAFNLQGLIQKVHVERGSVVKEGDLLVSMDDRVEAAQLDYLKLRADTSLQVSAAEREFNLAKVRAARALEIFTNGGGNRSEVEETEAEAAVREINIAIRKREGDEAAAQARAQQFRVEQMKLLSPIDGVVTDILLRDGEVAEETRPVIEVVKLDPLRIEIKDLPHPVVATLTSGQELQVRYRGESQWRTAKVDFISPLVDEATNFQLVRLEMPNPERRPAGLEVEIRLPAPRVANR